MNDLPLQVRRLRLEDLLLDGPRQITVQKPILHPDQVRLPFGQCLLPLPLKVPCIRERRFDGHPEPLGDVRRHLERPEFRHEHVQQVLLPDSHRRMVLHLVIVRAPVVNVLTDAAVEKLAADTLACHREPAMGAANDPAREHMDMMCRAPVLAVQNVLARIEGLPVDQEPVLALVDASIAVQFPCVEPVVEDV